VSNRDNLLVLGALLAGLLWLLAKTPKVTTTIRFDPPTVPPPAPPPADLYGMLSNEWWVIYAAEAYGYHGPLTGADIVAMQAGFPPGAPPPA
jgi:hypothetical protein